MERCARQAASATLRRRLEAVGFEVFGVEILASDRQDIIRSRVAADRPQDRQDVIVLREILRRREAGGEPAFSRPSLEIAPRAAGQAQHGHLDSS